MTQFTNSEGQPVEFIGTIDQALAQGFNVNCTNCTSCTGCVNCYSCTNCANFTDCTNYKDSNSCVNCHNGYSCHHCRHCTSCRHCNYCIDCHNCTSCSWHRSLRNCSSQPQAVIFTGTWPIYILAGDIVQIGCRLHLAKDWLAFSDSHIGAMHPDAVRFRNKWRAAVLAITNPS